METESLIDTDLVIDNSSKGHLKETATWAKFLAVVGFAYSVLITFAAIWMGSLLTRTSGRYSGSSERMIAGGSVGLIYLVFAVIVFLMSMYLFRFAKKTQAALQANDQFTLTEAFKNQKVFFRFAGIITVVSLILTILAVASIFVASSFSR